ncbi:MAG: ATP-binding cassette domain-containing protein, partial [Protaetiibacter sp.]
MTLTTEPAGLLALATRDAPRIRVRGLSVGFTSSAGHRRVVNDVSFELHPGRCLAIVGESGSGKSTTAMATMGLLPKNASVRGSIVVD